MATDTQATVSTVPRLDLYRLNVQQVIKMAEAGIFSGRVRVELLGGILVQRMTKYVPHSFASSEIYDLILSMLPRAWTIRKEEPVELGPFWRPEPDLSILVGPKGRYRARTPDVNDVAFLVEVSDSTYRTDRGAKWRVYASAGVPTYWIVNLNARQVEVYRDPVGKGKSATYQTYKIFGIEDSLPVILDGVEVGQITVKDIMP